MSKQFKHGTSNGYRYHKCRCDLCREAKVKENRNWREKNPTYQPTVARKHYLENKGDYLERSKNQRVNQRDLCRTWSSNRRARVRNAFVEQVEHSVVFESYNYICQMCGIVCDKDAIWPASNFPSLDHIIPLSKGGEHSYKNTQCLCLGCNQSKGVKIVDEWVNEDLFA